MKQPKTKTHSFWCVVTSIILLTGCIPPEKEPNPSTKTNSFDLGGYGTHTVEHDSCEYVIWLDYQKGGITHKGNCKYCQKRSSL